MSEKKRCDALNCHECFEKDFGSGWSVCRRINGKWSNGQSIDIDYFVVVLTLCQSFFLVHPFLISHSFFLCCSLFLCDSIVSDHDLLASCVLETCFFFARNISLQIFMKHRESCAPLFISIFFKLEENTPFVHRCIECWSDWLSLTFASLCLSHRKKFFVFFSLSATINR